MNASRVRWGEFLPLPDGPAAAIGIDAVDLCRGPRQLLRPILCAPGLRGWRSCFGKLGTGTLCSAAAVNSPVHVVVAHWRSGRDALVESSSDLVLFTIVAPFEHDSTPCDQWECNHQDDEHDDPFLQKISALRIHSPVHKWSNCDPRLQDHLHQDLKDRGRHF